MEVLHHRMCKICEQVNEYIYLQVYLPVSLMPGADQWGNMVGGYELVKSIHGVRTLSLTTPLLLSGESKMGKSSQASSQIWLDPQLTSPYQLFQFLIQRTDAESPQVMTDPPLM